MPKNTFLLSKVCKSSPFCVILRENRRFLCRSGMYLYNNRAKKKRAGNKSDSFSEWNNHPWLFFFLERLLVSFEQFVLHIARNKLVILELHRERSASAGERGERGGV